MTQFLQALVNGVSLAGIYALVALGFVIIYKSMQVLNFAQPALLLLGGYWVLYFATIWDLPFGIAILIGAALAALTGVIVERTTLRPGGQAGVRRGDLPRLNTVSFALDLGVETGRWATRGDSSTSSSPGSTLPIARSP
jgi:branched-subunit amino acid ABC-type transport system permease component